MYVSNSDPFPESCSIAAVAYFDLSSYRTNRASHLPNKTSHLPQIPLTHLKGSSCCPSHFTK